MSETDNSNDLATAARRHADAAETARANRTWWDLEAEEYYAEHGGFLGDDDFVWGPEGLRESSARLLGQVRGRRLLEIGAGAAQCSRYAARQGGRVVATDISRGMLRRGADLNRRFTEQSGLTVPLVQCDATTLPFADGAFDTVFTSYGAVPFVADSAALMAEAARVLRPGGRFVFSTTHPIRWALPDDPGYPGLVVSNSYFDRTPYVEQDSGVATYVEHHRTLGDRVRELTATGLHLVDLVEPEWPPENQQVWGGWSPLRGTLIPGTAIFVCDNQ
ncbi:MAG: class I SAM-dependent methyltransferase [Dermatophilaceae bacterium]|nr:class I SAM-dependent methyltransferase [Dermatophilaceae bacterium]